MERSHRASWTVGRGCGSAVASSRACTTRFLIPLGSPRMAYKSFSVPPYGNTLIVSDDAQRTARVLCKAPFNLDREDVLEDLDLKCSLGTTWVEGHTVLIHIADGSPATLVHECVHAGLDILERAGIDPRSNNGECLAYLVDWLYGQCSLVLFKRK